MKKWPVAAAVLMVVLHHDFWWWDDTTLILGFLPVGLAWHMVFSMLAAVLAWAAVTYAWPLDAADDPPEAPHS